MSKHLVIVESPAKAKTIKKYLGKDYDVLASYGHVRDLVPKEGAVDPNNHFAMKYDVIERNQKHIDAIAKALKNADSLLLATDPDREGEAISWHIVEYLREKKILKDKAIFRVVFHEITERAILDAVANPRQIAQDLVNAQQARRALDYLVGFNLSPLLWKKVRRGLSAGRVQTPALRMICEREDEIDAFVSREYWSVEAETSKNNHVFSAKLTQYQGDKITQFSIENAEHAASVKATLLSASQGQLRVLEIEKKQRKRHAAPPFTTSTLQQEASRKLGFSASRTMKTAQQLYEGVDTGSGAEGLITYMRTDSVSLSQDALNEIRHLIKTRFGEAYLPSEARFYKTKAKNAQEAHEAVRPTSVFRHPDEIKNTLSSDQYRLYELIWKRTIACQMQPAILDTVAVDLAAGTGNMLRANGSTIAFLGFMSVYMEGQDDSKTDDDEGRILPPLTVGDTIPLQEVKTNQHFTEPPPRFTEASLVKTLEEYGIGRPSTYATIISTLQSREYVVIDARRFTPTDIGRIVSRFLTQHFTRYVDYDFTAHLEDELDDVARGEREWVPLMEAFWKPFKALCDDKDENVSRAEVAQSRELGTDPATGKPVSVRMGRYGAFVQIGDKDDEEKPRFASLRPEQRMDSLSFDEAMTLFNLPRDLGETETGDKIRANVGRFGPYIQYGKKYVSLKEDDPYVIDLERALVLIAEHIAKEAAKHIKSFENTQIQVLNGRFGPYITDGEKNAKIPKDKVPSDLSQAECEALLAAAPVKRGAKAATKKTTAKKPAAKKASTATKASASSTAKKTSTKKTTSKTSTKTAAPKKPTVKKTAKETITES